MKMMLGLMMVLVVFSSSLCHADTAPAGKFWRGAVNIVTAPLEVPKEARAYWIKGAQLTPHILVWIFCGSVWGLVQGIKRVGSGVWDIVSFPIDKPVGFEPLFKPDYVFQEWPRNPKSGR